MAPNKRSKVTPSTNPIIADFKRRNERKRITIKMRQESNVNLQWKNLPNEEKDAYNEKLSKLQLRYIAAPRLLDWGICFDFGFEDDLREMMSFDYISTVDGNSFVDLSWERALSIDHEVIGEWVLECVSTFYFDRDIEGSDLMKKKCIWFRLCGQEHKMTLPEFGIALGLYTEDDVKHPLFATHFARLEIDDRHFNQESYWRAIGLPTNTNRKENLVKQPLMRIVHKILTGSMVHRVGSRERCNKRDLWMMRALDEKVGLNLVWVIADHLCRHAPGIADSSQICAGHMVTRLGVSLGFYNDEELKKCEGRVDCEYYNKKMLAEELDKENDCLVRALGDVGESSQAATEPAAPHVESFSQNTGWGDWYASMDDIERGNMWRDSILMKNHYMLKHSMPILHGLADQSNISYPPYDPPTVPPYPYPYMPYPYSYTQYTHPGTQGEAGTSQGTGNEELFGSTMPRFADGSPSVFGDDMED